MTMPSELRVIFILFAFVALFLATRSQPWWERLGLGCLAISLAILAVYSTLAPEVRETAPFDLDRISMNLMWAFIASMFVSLISDARRWFRRRAKRTEP